MSNPNFSNSTVEILAKRAGYICSNPDCKVHTIGPNSENGKTTVIGEAAHIFAAHPKGPRFKSDMSDFERSSLTNGVWLCRNCHKEVDRDPKRFPSDLLFMWREKHETYVLKKLGSKSDIIRSEIYDHQLEPFKEFTSEIRRIVLDMPPYWEYRLTAEIFRHLSSPTFRKLRDLKDGLYTEFREKLGLEEFFYWHSERWQETQVLLRPIEPLITRLNASWGKPGVPGDAQEILHICSFLNRSFAQIVSFEERLRFTRVPPEAEIVKELMQNILGSQIEKLSSIPELLDQSISEARDHHSCTADRPLKITHIFEFEIDDAKMEIMEQKFGQLVESYIEGSSSIAMNDLGFGN